MSKKSQVSIFIIIAIVFVAAIALFYLLFYRQKIELGKPSINSPEQYIEKCAKDAALQVIDNLLEQGGTLAPENYREHNGNKVAYLCYTNAYYKTCAMQEPLFIEHIEKEIYENITSTVDSCFFQLKSELEKENNKVEMGSMDLKVELADNLVRIKINRKFTISKNGETRNFEEFKSYFSSKIYNLAIVAQEIANQEAKFCYFEYMGFMILYPEYKISRNSLGQGIESAKIYSVQDRNTGKKLNIAIRSCEIPPGF